MAVEFRVAIHSRVTARQRVTANQQGLLWHYMILAFLRKPDRGWKVQGYEPNWMRWDVMMCDKVRQDVTWVWVWRVWCLGVWSLQTKKDFTDKWWCDFYDKSCNSRQFWEAPKMSTCFDIICHEWRENVKYEVIDVVYRLQKNQYKY